MAIPALTLYSSHPKCDTLHHPRPSTLSQPSAPPHVLPLTSSLQWKVLVLDDTSKKLLDNVLHPDDILNESITSMPSPDSRFLLHAHDLCPDRHGF
jgi:hypothetical protein